MRKEFWLVLGFIAMILSWIYTSSVMSIIGIISFATYSIMSKIKNN